MWTALDVFIGLTLCYALISLFCTALQEFFSQYFNAKGKALSDAMKVIGFTHLEDELKKNSLRNPSKMLSGVFAPLTKEQVEEDDTRYRSALENGLRNPFMRIWTWWRKRRALFDFSAEKIAVSVLTAKQHGLLDDIQTVMAEYAEADAETRREFVAARGLPEGLIAELKLMTANELQSAAKLKTTVEKWVDGFLSEVEEWSNRRAQAYSLAIGMAVALCLNVDTIAIAHSLADDPAKRAAVVDVAETYIDDEKIETCSKNGEDDEVDLGACLDEIEAVYPFPIGWDLDVDFDIWSPLDSAIDAVNAVYEQIEATKIVGLLLSGLALSLGSRYWFDTLKNLLALRAGRLGTRPQTSNGAGG